MENVLEKIKNYRKKKGSSYEDMGIELITSASAYRKIETSETKLTVEKLYKIAKILEVKAEDILDIESNNQFNQTNKDTSTGYLQQQQIENFYQENKEQNHKIIELYEVRLKEKEEQIALLKMVIEKLSK